MIAIFIVMAISVTAKTGLLYGYSMNYIPLMILMLCYSTNR